MAKRDKRDAKVSKKSPLTEIKKLIVKAAKVYKVQPHQLNKLQFLEFSDQTESTVKEWDLRKLGGFEAVLAECFPAPKVKDSELSPLNNAQAARLNGHELSSYIADVIQQCAEDMKVNAHELTWVEFRSYIDHAYGKDNAGIGRYNITRAGGFNAIRDAYFPKSPTKHTVDRTRLYEHANLNRKLGSVLADRQFVMENIEEFAKRCFEGKIKPVPIPKSGKIKRVVNVVLSDLHIGSDLLKEETGYLDYGRKEEARRLAAITKQIASYKQAYRSESKLVVHLIGDIIQGILHDMRDGAVQAEQFARALHILSQMFAQLAASYPQVDVHCATGNHGRNTARHKERAIHQKWDSHETELYVSLKYACSNLKNVRFFIPKTPHNMIQVLDHKFFSTHGDTVLRPGFPGSSINVKGLAQQIDKINASLPDSEEFSVFLVGHVHTPSVTRLDNGAWMITNGCMVPVDQYAVSIGIMENHCGQWIWESVKGYPVGDIRLINVGKEHDVDASLDAVISPWEKL